MQTIPESPLLTIAIPTYNGEKTLASTLESVLIQIDGSVPIEVLISDNCSTDDTPIIIDAYAKEFDFIRIIRNEWNIGPDANYLQCCREAKGDFVHLLSDDDILIEGSLERITSFLNAHNDLSLVALNTLSFRDEYRGVDSCTTLEKRFEDGLVTTDKRRFMQSALRSWGFLSSYIVSRRRFSQISCSMEDYYDTNWLQSYIHILCSDRDNDLLGTVGFPCIAAGVYGNVANFDVAQVDAINYRNMLLFAVKQAGYDEAQLMRFYEFRIALLGRHAIIKERASGIKRTDVGLLFNSTRMFPRLWITLYPAMLLPSAVCKAGMCAYLRIKGYSQSIVLHRNEEDRMQRVGNG